MVPSPHAQPQQRGWQRCWRHNRCAGSVATNPLLRADPLARGSSSSSPACRPPAALPTGNAPGGGSAPRGLGVLDRAPSASPYAAPGVAAPAASASAAAPPAPAALPDRTMGYLSLSLVPILWGTYNPCIRYLYAEADPLDPASLTAVRTLLSAGALLLPALLGYLVRQGQQAWRLRNQAATEQRPGSSSGGGGSGDGFAAAADAHHEPLGATLAAASDGAADGVAAAAAAEEVSGGGASEGAGGDAARRPMFAAPLNSARFGPVLTRTFDSVVLGGLELGLLNFLGTALQVEGLHSTSATRAGFLAEVTAVLTPFVSYLAGYDIPRQMWLAVAVGLVGSTMVAYDTSQAHDDDGDDLVATVTAAAPTPSATTAPAAALPATAEPLAPAAAAATTAATTALDAGPSSLGSDALESNTSTVTAADPTGALSSGLDGAAAAWAGDAAESASRAAGALAAEASSSSSAAALAALATPATDAGATAASVDLAAAAALQTAADAAAEAATSASDAAGEAVAAAVVALADTATQIGSSASAAAVADAIAAAVIPAVDAASSALEAVGPSAADAASGAVTAAAVEAVAAAAAASGATPLAITGGEAYLLLACLFYSICTVRMGIYAPRHDTVSLAAMKKVGLSSMSVMWMAATNLQNGAAPGSVLSFPDLSTRTPISIAVLMYSGLGPGALATFLQVTGLSTVPATTAQVIYSITPLLTAFFAYLILGGEATGPVAWVGGGLIIGAALLAADAQQKQQRELQQKLLEQQQQQQ